MRTLRFVTLLLAALDLGLGFAHTLELPSKMKVAAPLYREFQYNLYAAFATVGGPVEIGSILAALILAYGVRKERRAFVPTLTGAILLLVAFLGIWLPVVGVANADFATWSPGTIPPEWTSWRDRWEYGHVARFLAVGIGFSLLLWSSLSPSRAEGEGGG